MARSERLLLAVSAAALLALRALAFLRYRFDSDEPQHLHVAWGWTAGLIQYRDVFDNHTPLFHIATAPLLAALGERPNILLWMRGAMVPLFAVVLMCTWLLGRRLYSERVGIWAAVLLAFFPPYFLKSIEYRTDNLWTAVWLVILVVVAGRQFTTARALVTGLLLGIALAVSMKTIVLAVALFGATAVRRALHRDRAAVAGPLVATVIGFAVVPTAIAVWFSSHGAWKNLVYCVFAFNGAVAETRSGVWIGRALFPVFIIVIVLVARRFREAAPARLFCALVIAFFVATLAAFWILISPRDLLPVMPLAAIFVAAAIDRLPLRIPVYAAIVIASGIALFYYADRFQNRTAEHITMMHQVLGLTRPGEPLMDIKGETIYRRRPFYYVFEAITRAQMRKGLIRDTVPEAIVESRCYVTQADGPMFPPRANTFVHEYFLDMGRLRAAGQFVREDDTFTIVVPGPYVPVNARGPVAPARELGAGTHRFPRNGEPVAMVWAPAIARGYSPFHLRDREF